MKRRRPPATGNEGIQATNVHAEVLAVGHGAKAVEQVVDAGGVEAVRELRIALSGLNLRPADGRALTTDVEKLQEAAKSPHHDGGASAGHALRRICDRLKAAGVIVSAVAGLLEPIKKIAAILRVPLETLGL